MIDHRVIEKRINLLKEYLQALKELKKISFEDIDSSLQAAWAVEHGLQLAIQSVIDIGNHILASLGENHIEEYGEIIDRLGKKGVIPSSFAKKIKDMTGFRNILVHEYVEVDLKRVYAILQNRLNDFEEFIIYIQTFLKNKKTDFTKK